MKYWKVFEICQDGERDNGQDNRAGYTMTGPQESSCSLEHALGLNLATGPLTEPATQQGLRKYQASECTSDCLWFGLEPLRGHPGCTGGRGMGKRDIAAASW